MGFLREIGAFQRRKVSGELLLVHILPPIGLLLLSSESMAFLADSAEVLPKGVFRVGMNAQFYFPIDERYNPDGDVEDIAVDFNATLNNLAFPALTEVETGFGLPPGSANIGDSVVSFEYNFTILEFSFFYGITDRLSAGVVVPWWYIKNNVEARLDAANATVGLNPFFGTPGDPFGGAPIVPIALGGVPLTTQQTKDLLSQGLDVNGDGVVDIPGFDYERFGSWEDDGFSDIEAGLRYQYLNTDHWRLAFTAGVRFPSGEVDAPDNLTDYGFGSGAWALLFRSNNDLIDPLGIKNLVLDFTCRYDLYLPDKEELRMLRDVNQPLTRDEKDVEGRRHHRNGLEVAHLLRRPHLYNPSSVSRKKGPARKIDHCIAMGFPEKDLAALKHDGRQCLLNWGHEGPAIDGQGFAGLRGLSSKVDCVIPFTIEPDRMGILGLGSKLVGEPHSEDDRELLATLVNNLVVALRNASSFEEIKILNQDLKEKNIKLEKTLRELKAALRKVEILESVKSHLSKFVPTTVSRIIEKSPTDPLLGTREQDVFVLFLDIEGYTEMCERVAGSELSGLVEKYFSVFMDAIYANNGDVNETAGDGLMVLYLSEDEVANAVESMRTALTIREKAAEIKEERAV